MFKAFARQAASDEALQGTQIAVFIRADKAERVADRVGAARAADPVNVILIGHREIVVDDVRDAVHIDAARRDVGRHQHPHFAGLESR